MIAAPARTPKLRASPRHVVLTLVLCALGMLVFGACDTRPKVKEPPKGPGIDPGVEAPSGPGATTTPTGEAKPFLPTMTGVDLEAELKKKAALEEKKRDFPNELSLQLSSAPSCITPRPSDTAPRSIDISFTVYVTPSGAVSRGLVSSDALEASELACLRQRAEATHFEPPFEEAPFAIHTTLHIDQGPQPPRPGAAPAAHDAGQPPYKAEEPKPEAAKPDDLKPEPAAEPSAQPDQPSAPSAPTEAPVPVPAEPAPPSAPPPPSEPSAAPAP